MLEPKFVEIFQNPKYTKRRKFIYEEKKKKFREEMKRKALNMWATEIGNVNIYVDI